jgi:hypothetical protein
MMEFTPPFSGCLKFATRAFIADFCPRYSRTWKTCRNQGHHSEVKTFRYRTRCPLPTLLYSTPIGFVQMPGEDFRNLKDFGNQVCTKPDGAKYNRPIYAATPHGRMSCHHLEIRRRRLYLQVPPQPHKTGCRGPFSLPPVLFSAARLSCFSTAAQVPPGHRLFLSCRPAIAFFLCFVKNGGSHFQTRGINSCNSIFH